MATDPSLALVLSGGGARGAFDAGVVEALDDAGVRPSIVSGTSAGALTGAGVACGWPGQRVDELGGEELPIVDDVTFSLSAIEVEIGGTSYWDGGLTSNTPVTAALEHGPDRALIVGAVPHDTPARPPRSLGDVIALAIGHVLRDALASDVDDATTVNELVEQAPDATRHRAVEVATVLPEDAIGGLGDLLDSEPVVARELTAAGRRAARRTLRRNGWGRT